MATFGKHDKAVTFLNFENGANLGADASGYARNGTASAVTQTASLGTKTNVGSFLSASDSGIDLTSHLAVFSAATALSISCWVRVNTVTRVPAVQTIFSASDNTQSSREIILFTEGTAVKFQIRNGSAVFNITVNSTLAIDTWYHIAASFDQPLGLREGDIFGVGVSGASSPTGTILLTGRFTPYDA